ncbi:MAG: Ribosomal small subunit methyltransferase [Planctomycetota bacterium]
MPSRFFVEPPITEDTIELVDAEAHHLLHVLRAKTGDVIALFDGTGREFEGEVGRLRRSSVEVFVRSHQVVDRESPRKLVVGVALPKGDRQRWLIEKLVELGVAECVPLETSRGVAQPEGGTLEKLRRAVIEASKQCGRNRLMAISTPLAWSDFVVSAPVDAIRRAAHPPALWPTSGSHSGADPRTVPRTATDDKTDVKTDDRTNEKANERGQERAPQKALEKTDEEAKEHTDEGSGETRNTATVARVANRDSGESLGEFLDAVRLTSPETPVFAAVGPEGGFSADEIATALHAGWRLVGLGRRILRIETAAMALATAVIAACDSQ